MHEKAQRGRGELSVKVVANAAKLTVSQAEYLLELEMPGVSKNGVEINVEANEIAIIARRQREKLMGEAIYCESYPDDYRRVFEIASDIDTHRRSPRKWTRNPETVAAEVRPREATQNSDLGLSR